MFFFLDWFFSVVKGIGCQFSAIKQSIPQGIEEHRPTPVLGQYCKIFHTKLHRKNAPSQERFHLAYDHTTKILSRRTLDNIVLLVEEGKTNYLIIDDNHWASYIMNQRDDLGDGPWDVFVCEFSSQAFQTWDNWRQRQ